MFKVSEVESRPPGRFIWDESAMVALNSTLGARLGSEARATPPWSTSRRWSRRPRRSASSHCGREATQCGCGPCDPSVVPKVACECHHSQTVALFLSSADGRGAACGCKDPPPKVARSLPRATKITGAVHPESFFGGGQSERRFDYDEDLGSTPIVDEPWMDYEPSGGGAGGDDDDDDDDGCDEHLEYRDACLPGFSCGEAPCIDPANCDPTATELDDAAKGIGFGELVGIGRFTSDEKDLVTAGYSILQQNGDLVEHACCLAFGPSSNICSCLMDFINDVGKDIDIRRGTNSNCPADATGAYGHVGGNNLYLCDCVFDMLLPDFLNGSADERMCAMMSMARFIVSELAHSCGFGDHLDECDPVVNMLDALSEGLGRRCGDAAISDCIKNCVGDVWWP